MTRATLPERARRLPDRPSRGALPHPAALGTLVHDDRWRRARADRFCSHQRSDAHG
jgi:hypothetical protein